MRRGGIREMKLSSETANRGAFQKEDAVALKGIAILVMMLHHCFRAASLYAGHAISFFPFPETAVVHAAQIAKICVSLFAFVSGYGLFLNYRSKRASVTSSRWIAKRYVSTMSGFWFIWIISAIVCQIINHRTSTVFLKEGGFRGLFYGAIDFCGLAKLFGTPTLNGTWWYMSAAVTFIVLVPLVFRLRNHMAELLIGCILLLRVLTGKNGDGVYTGNNSIYVFLTPFLLGSICANGALFDRWAAIGKGVWWKKAIKIVAELAVLLLLFILYRKLPIKKFWEFHYGLVPFVLILFCVEFIVPIPGLKQVLRFLGKHSYNIFLVHTFIRGYYLGDVTYSMKHFALVILFVLGSSLVISIVIELLKKAVRYDRLTKLVCSRITGE